MRLGQHRIGQSNSLYEAFPAAEARRLVERFEWHYKPKHGSWLNKAKSELSVLSGQCLYRRIPDKLTLTEEAAAWARVMDQGAARVERPGNVVPLNDALRRRRSSVQGGSLGEDRTGKSARGR